MDMVFCSKVFFLMVYSNEKKFRFLNSHESIVESLIFITSLIGDLYCHITIDLLFLIRLLLYYQAIFRFFF